MHATEFDTEICKGSKRIKGTWNIKTILALPMSYELVINLCY